MCVFRRGRIIDLKKREKEEEKRALARIRDKLAEDKAERRRKLGLPAEVPPPKADAVEEEKKNVRKPLVPVVRSVGKAEQMRECLRGMKQAHASEEERVKKAFSTLLLYVGNLAQRPEEDKVRKIRVTNTTFQVGACTMRCGCACTEERGGGAGTGGVDEEWGPVPGDVRVRYRRQRRVSCYIERQSGPARAEHSRGGADVSNLEPLLWHPVVQKEGGVGRKHCIPPNLSPCVHSCGT